VVELPLVSPLERAVFLRAQPYFEGLESGVIAALAGHTREHRARAGAPLHVGARPLERVSFIVEGRVRMVLDDETLFEIDAPGGVGLAHRLARRARLPTAVAVTDCLTLQIDFNALVQILEDRVALVLQFARIFSRLILDSERKIDAPARAAVQPSSRPPRPESLDLVHRLAWARRSPIFQDANLSVLGELMRNAEEVRLDKEEPLWRRDAPASAIALLVHGTLRVGDGSRSRVVHPGSLLGIPEVFAERPRNEDAVAETPSVLMRLDRSPILDAMEDHFELSLDLLSAFATRYLASWAPRALPDGPPLDFEVL